MDHRTLQDRLDAADDQVATAAGLVDALAVLAAEIGGTPIEDPHLAQVRDGICAISEQLGAVLRPREAV
ncbi:MAG: hypothetical protein ACU0DW_14875 [Shimia sp.]